MRSISENALAVVIPLLAAKIRDLKSELRAAEATAAGGESEDVVELQLMLDQYGRILEALREEYEAALAEGVRLPSYETLTSRFHDSA